jgi:hypothetical protein
MSAIVGALAHSAIAERQLRSGSADGNRGGQDASSRAAHRPSLIAQTSYDIALGGRGPERMGMKFWLFLEHPTSSVPARVWSVVVTFTILLSSFTFVVGTIPVYHANGQHTQHFDGIEYYSIVVFTVEYVGRWIFFPVHIVVVEEETMIMKDDAEGADDKASAGQRLQAWSLSRLRFMRKPMNLVDLAAIIPFFIELILDAALGSSSENADALAVLRVVRITRIFRLLKLGKNNNGMEILAQTMKASWSFLVSVLFLMVIITVLYASIVFFFETASYSCVSYWECEGGADNGTDCTLLYHFDEHDALVITRDMQATMQQQQRFALHEDSSMPTPPRGAIIPRNSRGDSSKCDPQSNCIIVGNICYNEFGAVTNYNSIPNAMWWCLVTM